MANSPVRYLRRFIGWLYFPILSRLAVQWHNDPNYSLGPLVPIFSIWVLWRDRSRLFRVAPQPSGWGFFILIAGMGTLVVGVLGSELFLSRFSLLLVLAGLVVFFVGWRCFRIVLFPWAFLLLMIPIPAIILPVSRFHCRFSPQVSLGRSSNFWVCLSFVKAILSIYRTCSWRWRKLAAASDRFFR